MKISQNILESCHIDLCKFETSPMRILYNKYVNLHGTMLTQRNDRFSLDKDYDGEHSIF